MANRFLEPTTEFMYTLTLLFPEVKTRGPTPAQAAIASRHWAHLQELYASKQLIFAGRTLSVDDDGFASVIFRANSVEEACAVMERDPGIREGLFNGHLYPYQVLLVGSWSPEKE